MARNKIEIEAGYSENPQALDNEMKALDRIAEWFADTILETARADVKRDILSKATERKIDDTSTCRNTNPS